MTDQPRKFETHLLPLTTAVAAALLVSGCGPSVANTDVAVCRDANGRRTADSDCPRGGGHGMILGAGAAGWYYMARGSTVPRVGEALSGGSGSPRAGVGYARASSASVSRGGFGGSAHGGGGGGGE